VWSGAALPAAGNRLVSALSHKSIILELGKIKVQLFFALPNNLMLDVYVSGNLAWLVQTATWKCSSHSYILGEAVIHSSGTPAQCFSHAVYNIDQGG